MVRDLHAAGLEVILDVVFNHTAEGGEWGPTLCFRGIDNAAYSRLAENRSRYVDDTGCGNTVDPHQPQALRLVMDSLRYWVQEMHVDGFRFDLAASLGRSASDFDRYSAFLEAVGQDPVISQAKLIAEPWDIGWGGYDLGQFPSGWSEGTASIETRFAISGAASRARSRTWLPASAAHGTCSATAAADRRRR
jgi:isoamylase